MALEKFSFEVISNRTLEEKTMKNNYDLKEKLTETNNALEGRRNDKLAGIDSRTIILQQTTDNNETLLEHKVAKAKKIEESSEHSYISFSQF